MSDRPRLSELTPEQLRARAAEYRRAAETERSLVIRGALIRLAERLEEMATEGERR